MIFPIVLLPRKGQGTPQHPIFAASETPYIGRGRTNHRGTERLPGEIRGLGNFLVIGSASARARDAEMRRTRHSGDSPIGVGQAVCLCSLASGSNIRFCRGQGRAPRVRHPTGGVSGRAVWSVGGRELGQPGD